MKLLIDADYIVYKSCASAEYDIDWGNDVIMVGSKFSEAYGNTIKELKKISNEFDEFMDIDVILFFSDSVNLENELILLTRGIEIVRNHVDTDV